MDEDANHPSGKQNSVGVDLVATSSRLNSVDELKAVALKLSWKQELR